jgi:hypothetical protein
MCKSLDCFMLLAPRRALGACASVIDALAGDASHRDIASGLFRNSAVSDDWRKVVSTARICSSRLQCWSDAPLRDGSH